MRLMEAFFNWRGNAALAAALLLAGCSTTNSQLTRCQEDKEQLLATIREQRETNHSLRDQVVSLETRLDEAEKTLARSTSGGTRLSSRPVKVEQMPWRSPAEGDSGPQKGIPSTTKTVSRRSDGSSGSALAALARREARVKFDADTGTATYDASISFEENSANLTTAGKRQLDQLASFLKRDDAADLRVLVSGYAEGRPSSTGDDGASFTSARQLGAARAQAVADYLDRHGIAEERLGISGVGSRGPLGGSKSDRLASSVQVHLLGPDVPVVGWGPTGETIRR